MEVVRVGLAAGPGSLPSPGRTSPVRTRAATRTVAANPPSILGLLVGLRRNRGAMAVLLSWCCVVTVGTLGCGPRPVCVGPPFGCWWVERLAVVVAAGSLDRPGWMPVVTG